MTAKELYYEKRAAVLVKNLKARHFEACYSATREEALAKALEWIPQGASIGWGGCVTAQQIGLFDAIRSGNYRPIDRDKCTTAKEREQAMKQAMLADVFITGANALSMDGCMVNIDGTGNRVAPIVYGPERVIVIAGMNKVCDTLDAAMDRARKVAAPMNVQRFEGKKTPCAVTAVCGDCKSVDCICNHILITRHCRPEGRIQFILVGEELGF